MSGYKSAMEGVFSALCGQGHCDSKEFVASESRLLAKQIMQFTPPLGPGGSNTGAQKAGNDAIRKEMFSLFVEVHRRTIDEVASEHGVKDINNAWRTRSDGTRLKLDWRNIDYDGSQMEKFHKQYRQKSTGKIDTRFRGKPNTWAARVVVPMGKIDPYIKKVQQRVGRWRATWGRVIVDLGGTVPPWVKRHINKVTDISISTGYGLTNGVHPAVDFGSRAFGVNSQWAKIQSAIRARTEAMTNRTKLVISNYNKDIARGIRPRRGTTRANETI